MASASPPTPRVERVSAQLAFVASESQRGVWYRTRPEHCTCPDWEHRSHLEDSYRCKHMELAFPVRCAQCGTIQVPAAGDLCAWCAEDLNEQAIAQSAPNCNCQGLSRRLRALRGAKAAAR